MHIAQYLLCENCTLQNICLVKTTRRVAVTGEPVKRNAVDRINLNMADFSDVEDVMLFQHVWRYVSKHQAPDWHSITRRMQRTKKTKEVLRNRFKALKRRYGSNLDQFPRRFHRKQDHQQPKRRVAAEKSSCSRLNSFDAVLPETLLLLSRSAPPLLPLTIEDSSSIIWRMFEMVTKAEIRQKSGKSHLNCGELHPTGVRSIIDLLPDINHDDIFADIGAGDWQRTCPVCL